MPRNVAATGLHWMTRTAFKKENICKHDVSFGWWQPCAQRLRKRLCVMCSASHDAIAKYQHSDCLAGAKIRQKKAFVKSILRKGYSFLALTIEIRQKKCCYLKKSTFYAKWTVYLDPDNISGYEEEDCFIGVIAI